MKICICDDDLQELNKTKNLVEEFFRIKNNIVKIDTYNDPNVLINKLTFFTDECNYDIYFLDVVMPVLGIDVAARIKEINKNAIIFFVTTSSEYAVAAFKVKAFNYILKPIDHDDFMQLLGEAYDETKTRASQIFSFHSNNSKVMSIEMDSVNFIESSNRRMVIHLITFEEIASPTLRNKFLESIPFDYEKNYFIVCHSSFVVNLNQIKSIEKGSFKMKNGEEVPISKQYYKEVKTKYIEYLAGNSYDL